MELAELLFDDAALQAHRIVRRCAAMREAVRAQGILRTVEGALPRLHITPRLIIHAARHTVANDLEVASRKVCSKRVAYRVHLDRVFGADSDHELAHGWRRESATVARRDGARGATPLPWARCSKLGRWAERQQECGGRRQGVQRYGRSYYGRTGVGPW